VEFTYPPRLRELMECAPGLSQRLAGYETAGRVVVRAVQGGRGYPREWTVERHCRALYLDRVWEGPSDSQQPDLANEIAARGRTVDLEQ
jgi:alkylation response protein AidB-like acyl-CoA dehydrogenase